MAEATKRNETLKCELNITVNTGSKLFEQPLRESIFFYFLFHTQKKIIIQC